MEELVRIAAKPIAFAGSGLLVIGLAYLGVEMGSHRGGKGAVRALAMIAAGGAVVGFAAMYGFSGF